MVPGGGGGGGMFVEPRVGLWRCRLPLLGYGYIARRDFQSYVSSARRPRPLGSWVCLCFLSNSYKARLKIQRVLSTLLVLGGHTTKIAVAVLNYSTVANSSARA